MDNGLSERLSLEGSIKGVSVETFVKEYKGQSQMHARRITGKRLSADTYDLLDAMFEVANNQSTTHD